MLFKSGKGEVYLAEDTSLKRQVAIKVLPQPFTQDKERLARFEREARVLASLNHPNIATIHGLEKAEGQLLLVMELIEEETLAEHIKKGSLPMQDALEVCLQIAEGLESAQKCRLNNHSHLFGRPHGRSARLAALSRAEMVLWYRSSASS